MRYISTRGAWASDPQPFRAILLEGLAPDGGLAVPERYPRFDPEALPPHDLVILPDEPYNFTAEDGPEAFSGTQSVLVSGRLLTWYGPSLTEAARVLRPGGRLLIAERLARPRGWFRGHALTWEQGQDLVAQVERAGFAEVTAGRHVLGRDGVLAVQALRPAG